MLPKKARDLIAAQAQKEGIPQDDLWDMVNFYYKQNVLAASRLLHPRIKIEGLGTLTFNHWLVDEVGYMTEKFSKIGAVYDRDKKKKAQVAENRKNKVYSEQTMKVRKWQSKKQTKSNDTTGETTKGLGEQGQDS